MKYPCMIVATLLGFGVTGCGPGFPSQETHSEFAAPVELKAELMIPNIELRWRNRAMEAGGYFVEYGNPGIPDFIILSVTRPDTEHFQHRNVAPETTFIYRVRPFFGKVSNVAQVTTGQAPPPGTPTQDVDGPLERPAGAPPEPAEPKHSLRKPVAIAPDSAPANLSAVSSLTSTTVDLRWKDHASDEDGYFIEMKLAEENDFKILALLPPDATSYRLTGLDSRTVYHFRVRAFFYGKPSNLARVTTGPSTP